MCVSAAVSFNSLLCMLVYMATSTFLKRLRLHFTFYIFFHAQKYIMVKLATQMYMMLRHVYSVSTFSEAHLIWHIYNNKSCQYS